MKLFLFLALLSCSACSCLCPRAGEWEGLTVYQVGDHYEAYKPKEAIIKLQKVDNGFDKVGYIKWEDR